MRQNIFEVKNIMKVVVALLYVNVSCISVKWGHFHTTILLLDKHRKNKLTILEIPMENSNFVYKISVHENCEKITIFPWKTFRNLRSKFENQIYTSSQLFRPINYGTLTITTMFSRLTRVARDQKILNWSNYRYLTPGHSYRSSIPTFCICSFMKYVGNVWYFNSI